MYPLAPTANSFMNFTCCVVEVVHSFAIEGDLDMLKYRPRTISCIVGCSCACPYS